MKYGWESLISRRMAMKPSREKTIAIRPMRTSVSTIMTAQPAKVRIAATSSATVRSRAMFRVSTSLVTRLSRSPKLEESLRDSGMLFSLSEISRRIIWVRRAE